MNCISPALPSFPPAFLSLFVCVVCVWHSFLGSGLITLTWLMTHTCLPLSSSTCWASSPASLSLIARLLFDPLLINKHSSHRLQRPSCSPLSLLTLAHLHPLHLHPAISLLHKKTNHFPNLSTPSYILCGNISVFGVTGECSCQRNIVK